MEISIEDVRKVFLDVLNGALTREEADQWAFSVIQKSKAKDLKFCPPDDRERIWAGVMYLYGIDSQVSPDRYLHSTEDIRAALEKI